MSQVSVIIVTYNSVQWIPALLTCLEQQVLRPKEIIFIDNASQDQTLDLLKDSKLPITLIQNQKNVWFSKGVNQGLQKVTSEYVYLLNPDATLLPLALQELAFTLDIQQKAGAVVGKITRGRVFDSFGVSCTRARQFYNRGEGELDTGSFDHQPVFGFSGGGVLLRMRALKDIAIKGEILDEDFIAYKDDIDLSYRFRLRGWDIITLSQVIGSHQRTIDATADRSDRTKAKRRKHFSPVIRQMSSRNHLWLLIKNEPFSSLLIDLPWIGWYELKKFLYALLFDESSFTGYIQALRGLLTMLQKRKIIQSQRLISPKSLRKVCRS